MGSGGPDDNDAQARRLVAVPLDLRNALRADGETGVGTPATGIGEEDDPAFGVGGVTQAVVHAFACKGGAGGSFREADISPTLQAHGDEEGGQPPAVADRISVRRLTPTECERLQGFPDGWTDVAGAADSPRYAALGDAVTVNVAEWIGQRILEAST